MKKFQQGAAGKPGNMFWWFADRSNWLINWTLYINIIYILSRWTDLNEMVDQLCIISIMISFNSDSWTDACIICIWGPNRINIVGWFLNNSTILLKSLVVFFSEELVETSFDHWPLWHCALYLYQAVPKNRAIKDRCYYRYQHLKWRRQSTCLPKDLESFVSLARPIFTSVLYVNKH